MGNSASNASSPSRAIRGASPAQSPGVHPSLRTKKKSLELPDLASLSLDSTRGRQAKSAPIPIPISEPNCFRHYQQCLHPQPQQPPPRARHLPSTADVNPVPSYPTLPRPNSATPRGRQQQNQVARMQELYNDSQQPIHSPSHHRSFEQETVRSSIPVALSKALPNELQIIQQGYPRKEDLLVDFVPVKIVWKGGGTQVLLARASDDEWKGRQPMEKESANVWTLTVMLRPGTHHVRFMVDGQWRVADDLRAAVDDQGSLANYAAVPIPVLSSPPAPPATVPREKLLPGQSFWSADSSADGENQQLPPQQKHSQALSGRWTNVLPPELIEAAIEEEAYLSASAGHYDVSSSSTTVTTGFITAPNIPPAPGLPRHLEKLILNTRVGAGLLGASGAGGGAAGTATHPGSGQASGGVGSGQGQAARPKDRDRERDREREKGERGTWKRATTAAASVSIPPPPPPSEDDSVPPSSRVPASSVAIPPYSSPPSSHFPSSALTSYSTPAGSRIISIDSTNMPALSDDGSVLPVPSHVVLHHLSTSAIRNGVLAVGNTIRYKKKYLTTIHYKPT